ncbi:MAG: flagellar biosynthetic protein FliO [Bryobacteraceae bacterium]
MSPAPDLGTGAMLAETLRVIAALAGVILAAVIALRYVLPKFMARGESQPGLIRMVARYPLEPKKTLYLVEAGGRTLLLGASERDIHFLASLDGAEAGTEAAARAVKEALHA